MGERRSGRHVGLSSRPRSGLPLGDLSFVYPLARGVAPIISAVFAFLLIKEAISQSQLLGVISISFGIVTLSLLGRGSGIALIYASLIGASVAAYSLLNSAGVRLSDNLFGFSAALEIASGVGFLLYATIARGRSIAPSLVAIEHNEFAVTLIAMRHGFRRNGPMHKVAALQPAAREQEPRGR
jgi:drug/metabolite transporter (DMT)-like permease